MINRIDRRKFLLGSGSTMLALPLLQAFAPRKGFAQTVAPPKRLIIFATVHGRCIGDGSPFEMWSPGSSSAALSSANGGPSPQLAPLAPILNQVVTFDGIDDIVRFGTGNGDGHAAPNACALTCATPMGQLGVNCTCDLTAGGPSIDYVAGTRLRANSAQYPSILFPANATEYPNDVFFNDNRFWTNTQTGPYQVSSIPQNAIATLFANIMTPTTMMMQPPPQPTLHDRMVQQRTSILDGVVNQLTALSANLNARDRMQLENHTNYIRTIEQQQMAMGMPMQVTAACQPPSPTAPPAIHPANYTEWNCSGQAQNPQYESGNSDNIFIPYTIQNLVQALACDITRVAVLSAGGDMQFGFQYPNGSNPFLTTDWHGTIHSIPYQGCAESNNAPNCSSDASINAILQGYQFFTQTFTQLVQALQAVVEPDGSTLLDNTLVVWLSEMGHGSTHNNFNLPVVLAGLGNAFSKGRHIVENRRTTGDLHANILRLLGTGSDMTFGETGTVSDLAMRNNVPIATALACGQGYPGYVTASTPLHAGPLSL